MEVSAPGQESSAPGQSGSSGSRFNRGEVGQIRSAQGWPRGPGGSGDSLHPWVEGSRGERSPLGHGGTGEHEGSPPVIPAKGSTEYRQAREGLPATAGAPAEAVHGGAAQLTHTAQKGSMPERAGTQGDATGAARTPCQDCVVVQHTSCECS